jgi:hypothetical protein
MKPESNIEKVPDVKNIAEAEIDPCIFSVCANIFFAAYTGETPREFLGNYPKLILDGKPYEVKDTPFNRGMLAVSNYLTSIEESDKKSYYLRLSCLNQVLDIIESSGREMPLDEDGHRMAGDEVYVVGALAKISITNGRAVFDKEDVLEKYRTCSFWIGADHG